MRDAIPDMEGAGSDGGRAIGDGFSRGIEGSGASTGIANIGARMIALVPLIAILLGTISSLVSGLFALSAAISPAAAGLAVLPGLAIAAASAFGILKASFSGIGAAFKAGITEQNNAVGTAAKNSSALAAAARAVERAQRGIGDAARQNADALKAANRAIADARRNLQNTLSDNIMRQERADRSLFLAERSLRDALERQAESQIKLTKARKDARDEIIQLQFALEDSVLGQERAAINLEKARRQLQLMSGLPPDNLMRREAELSYKEAELAVRKTAEQFDKATQAADEATQKGVENSDTVKDAKKAEVDAAEAVADANYRLLQERKEHARTEREIAESNMLAQRALTDALERRQRVLQENARRTQDAQEALTDALRSQADAANTASGANSAFAKKMAELTPVQREFVKYLLSINKQWKELKNTLADNVLGPAQKALEEFMTGGLFDDFSDGMIAASKAVGGFFTRLEDIMKTPVVRGEFKTIMDSNVTVIGDMSTALSDVIRIILAITAAAAPMTERFSGWVSAVTGDWAAKAEGNGERMTKFFKRAGDVAAQLGRIIGNIATGIFRLGQTAVPAGQNLLSSFEGATQKFRDLVSDDEDKKRFKKYFDDVATNVRKIGDLFNAVVVSFAKLGDNKGIGETADILRLRVLPGLEKLLDVLNGDAAPAIANFLGAFVDMFQALGKSPALEIFLGTMTTLANVITALATNPLGQAALVFLGTLLGVAKSLALVKKVLFIDQMVAGLKKINAFVGADTGKKLKTLFSNAGDDAEKAAKRINTAFDNTDGPDGKGKKGSKTPVGGTTRDGVDRKTAKAGDDFGDNLGHLRRQFKLTGDAKDAFILNLQKLSGQFAKTGAAAGGAAGPAAAKAGAGVADDAALAAAGAGKGADKVDDAAKRMGKAGGVFAKVKSGIGGLVGVLGGLIGVSSAVLGPILLVVAAIAGIVLIAKGAWDRSEKLRDTFENKLKPALEKLWKAIKPAVDAFKEMIDKGLKKLGDFIADKVLPVLIEFVDWIAENIPPVVDFFVEVFDWISEHWDIISKILFAPFTFFTEILPNIIQGAIDLFKGAVDKITSAWDAVTTFFSELPGKIAGFFSGIWDSITEGATAAKDWIVGKFEELLAFIKDYPARVKRGAERIWGWISDGATAAKDWVVDKFNKLVDFIKELPARNVRAAKKIWGFITDTLGGVKDWVTEKFNQVVTMITGLPARFVRGTKRIWGFLTDTFTTARDWVVDRIDGFVRTISGLPSRIGRVATGMFDGIKNAFRNALNWIIDRWNNLSFSLPSVDIPGIGKVGGFTLSTPNIPRLAQGGIAKARPGGIIANIAEAGRDERVQPLGANGLTKGEELIIAALKDNSNQRPVEIKIYAQPNQDVYELARIVSNEIGFQLKR